MTAPAIRHTIGHLIRRREGTAALEMALISPMLLLLLTGLVDYSRVYREEMQLSATVSAAVQYTMINASQVNGTNGASLAASLTGIVANGTAVGWASASATVNGGPTSAANNSGTTAGGTAADANNCWCPAVAGSRWTWGAATACGTVCTGGELAGKFVTIVGTRTFDAVFSHYGFLSSRVLRQAAIVRVQ